MFLRMTKAVAMSAAVDVVVDVEEKCHAEPTRKLLSIEVSYR